MSTPVDRFAVLIVTLVALTACSPSEPFAGSTAGGPQAIGDRIAGPYARREKQTGSLLAAWAAIEGDSSITRNMVS